MTPLPAVAGVLQIDYRFTIGGDTNVHSKLHFRYTGGPPNQSQLNALAGSCQTAFSTNCGPQLHSSIVLNQVIVQDLANPTAPVGTWSGAVAGTMTGSPNAASICAVTAYRINRRYRGGHPRGYWPFLNTSAVLTPGSWGATAANNVTSAMTGLVAAIKALTTGGVTIGNQCAVSYYSGGTWSTPTSGRPKYHPTQRSTPQVDDVVTISTSTRMGSQRRRLKRA